MSKFLGWMFHTVMRGPWTTFRTNLSRPYASQSDTLRRILSSNQATEFGRNHGFATVTPLSNDTMWREFQNNTPIRRYDDFAPMIDRMKNGETDVLIPGRPSMFSLTSGTTSEPKFCPVNRQFIREHHRQHLIWMYNVFCSHPRSNSGKYLVMASPAEMGRTLGGIPYGAMSGKQLDSQSIPVRRRQAVPALAHHLKSAEDRWLNVLLFAMACPDLRVVTSVNPSTLVALASRMDRQAEMLLDHLEHGHPAAHNAGAGDISKKLAKIFKPDPVRAKRLREVWKHDGSLSPAAVWPDLEIILTWQGGASSFYLPHIAALWGTTPQRCLGLRASEGTFSIPLADNTPSGVLAAGGHAMEFYPAEEGDPRPDSPTLLAHELEQDSLYRLIITTSGGLYRYDMGDLVRVTGYNRETPEVAFERRAGSVLSATGEKVTEDQVIAAMESAAANGPLLTGFTVTYEMDGETTRYVVALECAGGMEGRTLRGGILHERLRQLLALFDDELIRRNCEYDSKRRDGRLASPRLAVLADGSYEQWRARRAAAGKPENQIKLPIMVAPPGPGRAPVKGCAFFDEVSVVADI